jgi:Bacterial TniB protein
MIMKPIDPPRYTTTQIAQARDTVSHIFITYRETKNIMDELKIRLETGCQSTVKPKTSHQARLTAIVAYSGFGKSAHIEHFLQSDYVAEIEAKGFSILHLELPADCTIKTMTTAFLHAMGDPLADKTSTAGRNSVRIVQGLQEMNCKLILIDEAQHLLGKKRRVLKDATDWLKVLLDRAGVPVIVIGLPEILVGIKSNVQLERRMTKCIKPLPMSWNDGEGSQEFRYFLRAFEQQVPLSEPSDLFEPTMAHAIHLATGGLVGRVVQLITEAMEISMRRPQGPDAITMQDLSWAYVGLNLNGLNPFDRDAHAKDRTRKAPKVEAALEATA